MPTEFIVTLRNMPGALAELGTALGRKGINIEALQAMSIGQQSIVRFVVNHPDVATAELKDHGVPFRTREVMVVDMRDEPGALGELADAMADAGVNIDAAYLTMTQRVILGVSELAKGIEIAKRMDMHYEP